MALSFQLVAAEQLPRLVLRAWLLDEARLALALLMLGLSSAPSLADTGLAVAAPVNSTKAAVVAPSRVIVVAVFMFFSSSRWWVC